jgi:hypothetical protein
LARSHPDISRSSGSSQRPFDIKGFNLNDPNDKTPSHNTHWKYVIGHEFGHVMQAQLVGNPGRGAYSGGVGAGRCGCSFVRNPEDKYHCLGSNEDTGAAQSEGFGHFYAAKLLNNLAQPECRFVYYKPSYDKVGATSQDPPAMRTCDDLSVRWLDTHCGGPTGRGTEWDWLNFYIGVHRGANATTMTKLSEIYNRACRGQAALVGRKCTEQPTPFSALSASALVVYNNDPTDPRYTKFLADGNGAGVNH